MKYLILLVTVAIAVPAWAQAPMRHHKRAAVTESGPVAENGSPCAYQPGRRTLGQGGLSQST